MHKYNRQIENRFRALKTGVEIETEEAILRATTISLFFYINRSLTAGSLTYQPFAKAMPDINKFIDFSKFKYINSVNVKPFGLLNAGSRLSLDDGAGELQLVWRMPGTTSDFIPVPELKINVSSPEGLPKNKEFGIEGEAFYDMSMVPAGATLMVQIRQENGRIYARGVQLLIQFRHEK